MFYYFVFPASFPEQLAHRVNSIANLTHTKRKMQIFSHILDEI